MRRTLILVAFLVGCGDAPEPKPEPTAAKPDGELIASVETSREYRRNRVCLDAGRYRLEARAPDGEPHATAFVNRDDGSEDGEYVQVAMRAAGQQRTVREPFTIDGDGHCYWLSIQTGIHGHTTEARLYSVK